MISIGSISGSGQISGGLCGSGLDLHLAGSKDAESNSDLDPGSNLDLVGSENVGPSVS